MFRRLSTLDEAKQIIHQHFPLEPIDFCKIPLLGAYGRVLAKDVISPLNVPSFSRSTVDGYAVKAEDTFRAEENQPAELKICGTIRVGEPKKAIVKHGSAAEIVTGAPMPQGANAVVMFEETERKKQSLHIYSAVTKDENVMKAGSDIRKGEPVLRKGTSLDPRDIGVLAALGLEKVKVYAIPRVAIFSTGPEIAELGRKLQPGKIYDINAYSLGAAVHESGGRPIHHGILPDNSDRIQDALREALTSADMVVTSGGVSVGPKDLMPATINTLGKPGLIVHGVAIKPGKPVAIASISGKPIFSLPGNPTSALLVFYIFVRPLIRGLAGRGVEKPLKAKALAATRMFTAKGRRTFTMVRLQRDGLDRLIATPVLTGVSGAITTLARADGFVEIAEDTQFVDANEGVEVCLFKRLEERYS